MPRAVRFWLFSLLMLSAAGAIFLVVYPLTIIQPFKRQDPVHLQRALLVFRIAPGAALALAALALLAVVLLWKKVRIWQRVACVILLVLTSVAAGLSRVDVFELMFHPAGAPKFLAIEDTRTAPDEMVIAVALKGQAHAYPIREMGYHHVINDWIGGDPVVATY
jgi:hypothetical protein